MPTAFGTLLPEEIRNGWTPATFAAYHAERNEAAGFRDRNGGVSNRIAGNTVTEYVRPRAPVRMETAMKFNPHKWGTR